MGCSGSPFLFFAATWKYRLVPPRHREVNADRWPIGGNLDCFAGIVRKRRNNHNI
jgi:hypothetical protein